MRISLFWRLKNRGAKSLVIGVTNNGGYIEEKWIPGIIEAIKLGLDIINGMHTKLDNLSIPGENSTLADLAHLHNVRLHNIRHFNENLPIGNGKKRQGRRLLTVGTDCSSGKMFTALHLHRALITNGVNSKFTATGQCGILIEGQGIAIDAVEADFIAGAVEHLTPSSDNLYIVEGQGSLFHPAYAGVSLGLLHGAQPDYLIMCHDVTRKQLKNFDYPLPELHECIELNERLGRLTNSNCTCIGISLNTSGLSQDEASRTIEEYSNSFGLPVTDPYRFGVDVFTDKLQEFGAI